MLAYVCDVCEKVIENPYEVKMKVFYIGGEIDFEFMEMFYTPKRRKQKVHLCDSCFNTLREIAMKKKENKNDPA